MCSCDSFILYYWFSIASCEVLRMYMDLLYKYHFARLTDILCHVCFYSTVSALTTAIWQDAQHIWHCFKSLCDWHFWSQCHTVGFQHGPAPDAAYRVPVAGNHVCQVGHIPGWLDGQWRVPSWAGGEDGGKSSCRAGRSHREHWGGGGGGVTVFVMKSAIWIWWILNFCCYFWSFVVIVVWRWKEN